MRKWPIQNSSLPYCASLDTCEECCIKTLVIKRSFVRQMADKNDKQFLVEFAFSRQMRKNLSYILPQKRDVPFLYHQHFLALQELCIVDKAHHYQ